MFILMGTVFISPFAAKNEQISSEVTEMLHEKSVLENVGTPALSLKKLRDCKWFPPLPD